MRILKTPGKLQLITSFPSIKYMKILLVVNSNITNNNRKIINFKS